MKNLGCNQIETFINLEIIGEKDKSKSKKIYFFFYFYNLVKPLHTTTAFKLNFYYIVYDIETQDFLYYNKNFKKS